MKRIFWIKLSTKIKKRDYNTKGVLNILFAVSVYELDPAKLLTAKLSNEPIDNNSDIKKRLIYRSKYFKEDGRGGKLAAQANKYENTLLKLYPDCIIFRKQYSAKAIVEELFK